MDGLYQHPGWGFGPLPHVLAGTPNNPCDQRSRLRWWGLFSPDSKQLIFRASRPQTPQEVEEYQQLLSENLVAPTRMELFVCNLDGSGLRQITQLGGANWAPYFHPDGQRVVFSSNHHTKRGFPFNLFMVNLDGSGLKQLTFDPTFDSFPMFSPDGRRLIFASNRRNGGTRDTNLILVDWVDRP